MKGLNTVWIRARGKKTQNKWVEKEIKEIEEEEEGGRRRRQ